jgi:hypothetical protein
MTKNNKGQVIQWPRITKDREYNGLFCYSWPLYCLSFVILGHCIACPLLFLVIVLPVLCYSWPLYCLSFVIFGHCIACPLLFLFIVLPVLCLQRTGNTMTKNNKGQAIQWPRITKDRQYNGQE